MCSLMQPSMNDMEKMRCRDCGGRIWPEGVEYMQHRLHGRNQFLRGSLITLLVQHRRSGLLLSIGNIHFNLLQRRASALHQTPALSHGVEGRHEICRRYSKNDVNTVQLRNRFFLCIPAKFVKARPRIILHTASQLGWFCRDQAVDQSVRNFREQGAEGRVRYFSRSGKKTNTF